MLTLTDMASGQQFVLDGGASALPGGLLRENGNYRIEFRAEGRREVSLFLSDEELPPSYKELTPATTFVRWDWQVTEYAGEVVLSLLEGNEAVSESVLDIAPNPYKLGAEVYRELLLDLQEKAEGLLFGMTPAQAHLEHQEVDVPPLARFALIRAYLPVLERTFRTIEHAPHRRLIAERDERPLHKVKRVDNRSLRTALKRMPVLTALQNRNHSAGPLATLDVPRREHTFDTSPNRHVLGLLFRLTARAGELGRLFDSLSKTSGEEPEYRRRAVSWAELSRRFEKRLSCLMRADFLARLKPAKPDTAALMAISRHPAYSRFDRIARHILSPRVALGNDAEKLLGLRPTYEIYEYWCFFTVIEAVKQALPDAQWQSNIALAPGKLLLDLKNGSSLVGQHGDLEVSVVFQQRYGGKSDQDGLFSMSKDCYPDIVLKFRQRGSLRTIILDAKYRASRESIHAALSDIHVYRDAIRRDAENSAVHAAFILTPAHHGDSQRYYTEDYREKFAFGGFDLSPRNPTQVGELVRALTGWVHEGY